MNVTVRSLSKKEEKGKINVTSKHFDSEMYGGILLQPTCKIKYIDMQHN